MSSVVVTKEDQVSTRVSISLKDPDKDKIQLILEDRDCEELVLVLCGYYRLLTEQPLEVVQEKSRWSEEQGESSCFCPMLYGNIINLEGTFIYKPHETYVVPPLCNDFQAFSLVPTYFSVQMVKVHLFSSSLPHFEKMPSRRHEYSQRLSRLLSVPGI